MVIATVKVFLTIYLFWYMYLATMSLVTQVKRERRGDIKIPLPAKILGYPAAVGFVVVDWIMNRTLFMLFLEVPKSWGELVTERLDRYADEQPEQWRGKIAIWICHNLLNVFDPTGNHCGPASGQMDTARPAD